MLLKLSASNYVFCSGDFKFISFDELENVTQFLADLNSCLLVVRVEGKLEKERNDFFSKNSYLHFIFSLVSGDSMVLLYLCK